MQISICIATLNRPKLLQRLLLGLDQLEFERIATPEVQIVVVDNDPSGSAETIARASMVRWPLVYCIEPRRGIAQARNSALDRVSDSDFIAFIDDDECPDPRWLEELLLAHALYGADVVGGPVLPEFDEGVPQWIRRGGFFDPLQYRDGEKLAWCATNNALVSRKVIATVQRFDEQFELSGADDLHFFRRAALAGFKISWTNSAIVRETIATDRGNLMWLLRRSYRGGNVYVLVERVLDRGLLTRAKCIARGLIRISQGAMATVAFVFTGPVRLTKSLRLVCLGCGMLAGLVGYRDSSYRAVTGS